MRGEEGPEEMIVIAGYMGLVCAGLLLTGFSYFKPDVDSIQFVNTVSTVSWIALLLLAMLREGRRKAKK